MDMYYTPPERISERFDECKLVFSEEVDFSKYEIDTSDGTIVVDEEEHSITYKDPLTSEGLTRANLEYDSPVVEGHVPDLGAFYYYTYSMDDEIIFLNKIFKPYGCTQVILYEYYNTDDVATCTMNFNGDETYYSYVLNFSSQTNVDTSVEYYRHMTNPLTETPQGFLLYPHIVQLNGSDYKLSKTKDYLYRGRNQYLKGFNLALPEFMNYSMARDGSKYFIGAYARDEAGG